MAVLKMSLEKFLKEYREEIGRAAKGLLSEEMPFLTEELFALFERTGSRLQYEEVYFTRRKFLAVLGLKGICLAEELRVQKAGNGISDLPEEKKIYFKKLAEVILSVCEEECWALPAHVDRSKNPDWRNTVDLFASETAQTLAELADRAGSFLPREVFEQMICQIEQRVLIPFFSSQEPYSGWERAENNWNAVCSGAIGSACIHLLNCCPERFRQMLGEISREREGILQGAETLQDAKTVALTPEDCLDRICRALGYYMDGFSEDGVCQEGLGYYTYGMTYFVNFAQELYEYTGGGKDLFCGEWGGKDLPCNERDRREKTGGGKNSPNGKKNRTQAAVKRKKPTDKLLQIAQFPVKCFWKDGNCISFSDGSIHESFRAGICSVLALHYGSVRGTSVSSGSGFMDCRALFPSFQRAAGLHTDTCYRFAALKMDLLYTAELLDALKKASGVGKDIFPEPEKTEDTGKNVFKSFFLPSAQWYIANAEAGVGFACKGGNNGEPHNHNDIGHFIYEAEGTYYFTDLGAGEYTKEYFGEGRYGIFCNRSLGHSVPVVSGQEQETGSMFQCDRFYRLPGESGAEDVFLEMHSAYQKGLLDQLWRKFSFDRVSGNLTVQDHFVFPQKKGSPWEIEENLITQIRPVTAEGKVFLQSGTGACVLELEQEKPSFRIRESVHVNHRGHMEKVYSIQWKVPCRDGEAYSRWSIRMA